jgi:hypothetical protein
MNFTGHQPYRKAATYTDNTNTENKTDIHAWSVIRTHDPNVRWTKTFHASHNTATVIGTFIFIFLIF